MVRAKLLFLFACSAFFIQETHSYTRVVTKVRFPGFPILPNFIKRWSSRVMSGEPIELSQLMTLLEAARWAPSSFNEQPWRFIYAMRDTPEWNTLFSLLVPFNQEWAQNAAVLIVVITKKTFTHNGTTNPVHLFDAGAAWMSIALQAQSMGLFAHGMAGFDYERARYKLGLSDDFDICAMIAVGHPGARKEQEKEEISLRRPLVEIAFKAPEIQVFPEPPAPIAEPVIEPAKEISAAVEVSPETPQETAVPADPITPVLEIVIPAEETVIAPAPIAEITAPVEEPTTQAVIETPIETPAEEPNAPTPTEIVTPTAVIEQEPIVTTVVPDLAAPEQSVVIPEDPDITTKENPEKNNA